MVVGRAKAPRKNYTFIYLLFSFFSSILAVACQQLVGCFVAFDVGAVTPFLKFLDAVVVRIQLLVDEAIRVGANYASHRRIIHDC